MPPDIRYIFEKGLFNLPANDHLRVRRAVSPAFTPRAVEKLRGEIEGIVDEALAPWQGKDVIDIAPIADFIPMRVIASMLHIPKEHDELFRGFGQALVQSVDPRLTPAQLGALFSRVPPGMAVLRQIIEERRKHPGDDLLSVLIKAEETGDKLSTEEMISLVAGLITAGSETTVHFISFSMLNLVRMPEKLAEVRKDRALLKGALEEVLRWDSFGKSGIPRYALEDVEISGTKIKKGEMVMALLPAAQRDPRGYPDADKFDPRREPEERIHFGSGPHYCLGANLAKLEGEVAVARILERYPTLKLAAEPVFGFHPFIRHIAKLELAVSPATKA